MYTAIAARGFCVVYLSSRNIGLADRTKQYISGLRQHRAGGETVDSLPEGPVITSPSRMADALIREVRTLGVESYPPHPSPLPTPGLSRAQFDHTAHLFKIDILEQARAGPSRASRPIQARLAPRRWLACFTPAPFTLRLETGQQTSAPTRRPASRVNGSSLWTRRRDWRLRSSHSSPRPLRNTRGTRVTATGPCWRLWRTCSRLCPKRKRRFSLCVPVLVCQCACVPDCQSRAHVVPSDTNRAGISGAVSEFGFFLASSQSSCYLV